MKLKHLEFIQGIITQYFGKFLRQGGQKVG